MASAIEEADETKEPRKESNYKAIKKFKKPAKEPANKLPDEPNATLNEPLKQLEMKKLSKKPKKLPNEPNKPSAQMNDPVKESEARKPLKKWKKSPKEPEKALDETFTDKLLEDEPLIDEAILKEEEVPKEVPPVEPNVRTRNVDFNILPSEDSMQVHVLEEIAPKYDIRNISANNDGKFLDINYFIIGFSVVAQYNKGHHFFINYFSCTY